MTEEQRSDKHSIAKVSIAHIRVCDCNVSPHRPDCEIYADDCPKCGAEDSMEHVKTTHQNIETHYDVCVVCQYRTDPE